MKCRIPVMDCPVEAFYDVRKVMELSLYLGFSMTPKIYCLECYAVFFQRVC